MPEWITIKVSDYYSKDSLVKALTDNGYTVKVSFEKHGIGHPDNRWVVWYK